MFQFLPMAIGAGTGLLTNKDPLQGAIQGAALGGLTGGLGGLGGARQADFSGLLRSQGQANNAAGAQRLLQQQMARKQGRL